MTASNPEPRHPNAGLRLGRVLFTPELLVSLTRGVFRIVENSIPADAEIRGAGYDQEQRVCFVIMEHPSFAPVEYGQPIPVLLPPVVRRVIDDELMP